MKNTYTKKSCIKKKKKKNRMKKGQNIENPSHLKLGLLKMFSRPF